MKLFYISTICWLVFLLNGNVLLAFNNMDYNIENKEQKKAKKDSIKQDKIDQGKFIMTPVAAPAYTPELGGLIAVGGLFTFKTNPLDTNIQRSSFPTTLGLSTTGAIVFQGKLTSYWMQDKLRIYSDLWYKNMPDNYWGVGYDKAYETPVSDTTTAFNRQWFWFNPKFLYQFKKNFFVGLNIDLNYTQGSNASQVVKNDPYYKKYNDKPFNAGVGIILQYDSRDVAINAWKGLYVNLDYSNYGSYLGGDNSYSILNFDTRYFMNTGRTGSTVATQLRSRIGMGDVPYGEMSQIGTPFDLRGYTWGRYRDESMAFFITEYRHQFSKADGSLSKQGVVTWVGGGSIFGKTNTQETNNKILPNYGVGYRLEVQPRMNIRLDVGFGRETMGIYFNFNESF